MSQKAERKKVLVVDDDPLNCEVLRELLSAEGYQVEVALSGQEALEVSGVQRPHIVLLDLSMPGKSGLETLRELKSTLPEAALIMLSGLHEEELASKAKDEGAAGYISKPIHPGRLMEIISGLEKPGGGG